MPLQVTRKDRESAQSLVQRFTKTVRQSGILLELRGKQFRRRGKSALAKKRSALRRVEVKAEKVRLEKLTKPK